MSANKIPSRTLPARASEEFLRKEAKRLAKQDGISLGVVQRALAHEYGYRSWPDLIAAANTILRSTASGTSLRDEEWSAIESLGDASLVEMPMAPGVKEWLDNRKAFPQLHGEQRQFVATLGERIVGYACAEHPPIWMHGSTEAAGQYRLFMVVEPASRRTLGTRLLARLRESLISAGARRAWLQEYEADAGLIAFLTSRGFVKTTSFQIEDGTRIVRLHMDAPFEALALGDSPAGNLHGEESR